VPGRRAEFVESRGAAGGAVQGSLRPTAPGGEPAAGNVGEHGRRPSVHGSVRLLAGRGRRRAAQAVHLAGAA
nr:hypothetical protein [Tanacetum cinerariifolium]